MATELITFKMESSFLKEVDDAANSAGYQSRTEFIREALREQVEKTRLKQAINVLSGYKGKAPKKTTDEERKIIRQKVFEEFDRKFR